MRYSTALLIALGHGLVLSEAFLNAPLVRKQRTASLTARNFFNFNKPEQTEEAKKEEEEDPNLQDGAYDPDDPIEKIFGFFFGKREASPAGLGM